MKHVITHEGQICANCGTALQGEFCCVCGQSIHSSLKSLHGMLEESLEVAFHLDGRFVHTLPPLLLNPGFLTQEYFNGRRVRYIAPFRLMFVLSLLAFFVIHLHIDAMSDAFAMNLSSKLAVISDAFKDADSPAAVRESLLGQLQQIDRARAIGGMAPAMLTQMDSATQSLRRQANQRLVALGAAPMSATAMSAMSATPIAETAGNGGTPAFNSQRHVQEAQPVRFAWLPDAANARLTAMRRHFNESLNIYRHGDKAARTELEQRAIGGSFSVLPPIMFVLVPLFTLLLKLLYVFKRRLYIEHLIVVVHSHAFLFLSLLLGVLVGMLADWIRPHAAWLAHPIHWIAIALWLWAPIYTLIMQKRIYRQNWPLTMLKYLAVGVCYSFMLTIALLIAGVLGLAY